MKIKAYRVFFFIIIICPLGGGNIGGISFLNIPASAVSSSLGNTMAADRGYPSALVQNPANIWQHQKNKFSFLYRKTDKELGAKYFNGFYSKRSNYFNKVTFALGFIQYDISKIERYDEQANFLGYFKYANWAIMGGLSLKGAGGMQGGVGFSLINQRFTNIGYEEEYFFGIDFGFNMDQVQNLIPGYSSNFPDLNLSFVNKTVLSQTGDLVRTASSNSIFGIQVVKKWQTFSVLWNTDYLRQPGSDMGFLRFGTQAKWLNVNDEDETLFEIGFGGGYNRFPVNSLKGTSYGDLVKYSGKWSLGLTLELVKIPKLPDLEIGYSYEIHPVQLDSQFISFRFSL